MFSADSNEAVTAGCIVGRMGRLYEDVCGQFGGCGECGECGNGTCFGVSSGVKTEFANCCNVMFVAEAADDGGVCFLFTGEYDDDEDADSPSIVYPQLLILN